MIGVDTVRSAVQHLYSLCARDHAKWEGKLYTVLKKQRVQGNKSHL